MGKNGITMRDDLRLDLKDSGSTWSNPELDRCVEKAVADLSRFLPAEKVYEESLQFTVTDESFRTPLDAVSGQVVAVESLSGAAGGDYATIDGQPDVPRPLRINVTNASGAMTRLTLIVRGVDEDGRAVSETFHYTKGDDLIWMGEKYFKVVYAVKIEAVAGNGASDQFEIGIGDYEDVWVSLAYKPIKHGSVTITDETEDTDFVMDYTNGRIKAITLTAGTDYDINYTKSKISIDLSSLPGFIRISSVEYPVGQVPQEFQTPDTWDKVITLGGFANESQAEITEDKHISVRYYAEHDAPTESSPGSYPGFLDWTVELAASSYALFIFAVKYEHQVATDLGLAATALTNTTAIHTLVDAALDKVTTYVADANDALDLAAAQVVLAAAALVKVTTYLEDNTNEDANYHLAQITSNSATLREAINIAVSACNTYLDEVDTTDLAGAEGAWAEEVEHIVTTATTPNAEDFIETGDDLINIVNVGAEVPELYRRYAETALNMAEKFADRRRDFLSEAGRRTDAAMGYIAEVSQRLSNLRSYIEQAAGWGAIASGFVDEAIQRNTAAQAYVAVADGKLGICRAFTAEADSRISEIDRHLGQAAAYQSSAAAYDGLAVRFREEAIERRNEAWAIWRDPKQYIGQMVTTSVRQTT